MKFTINGKEYESAKYSFNTHCQFDEMGVNVLDIKNKPFSILRAYFSISSGMDLDTCGDELEAHIMNGGKLDDITTVFLKELDKSDFFRSLVGNPKKKEKKVAVDAPMNPPE